jgi:hypothetical protein
MTDYMDYALLLITVFSPGHFSGALAETPRGWGAPPKKKAKKNSFIKKCNFCDDLNLFKNLFLVVKVQGVKNAPP